MERERDQFKVTAESRAEHLSDWSDEELLTLHTRLTEEVAEDNRVLSVIEEILAERDGVNTHAKLGPGDMHDHLHSVDGEWVEDTPAEMLGDRPPLEGLED